MYFYPRWSPWSLLSLELDVVYIQGVYKEGGREKLVPQVISKLFILCLYSARPVYLVNSVEKYVYTC